MIAQRIGTASISAFAVLTPHTPLPQPTTRPHRLSSRCPMASCTSAYHGHREGWGPVSTLREFDLTPCFEEGIILPTLLVVLLLVSLSRLWRTRSGVVNRTLTSRSASVLTAKLVRSLLTLHGPLIPDDIPSTNPPRYLGLAWGRLFR